MEQIVRQGARDPEYVALARDILASSGVPERDQMGEVRAIHGWVKSNSRYTNDSTEAEVLSSPREMMRVYNRHGFFVGDCDELVALEAVLLRSIGRDTRYVTVSQDLGSHPSERMSHIYHEVLVDGEWVALDPIMKRKPVGWAPPDYTAKKVFNGSGLSGNRRPEGGQVRLCGPQRYARMPQLRGMGDATADLEASISSWYGGSSAPAPAATGPSTFEQIFGGLAKGVTAYQAAADKRAAERRANRAARAPDVVAAAARGEPVAPDTLARAMAILGITSLPGQATQTRTPAIVQQNTAPAGTQGVPTLVWVLGGVGALIALGMVSRR